VSTPQSADDRYCPRCGVAYEPTQEYCLECGARLPTNAGVVGVLASAWQRRIAWYPGDWIWPTLLFLVLAAASTAVALAANSARHSTRPVLAATTPSVPVGPGASPTPVQVSTSPATLPVPTNQPTITNGPLPSAPGSGTGAVSTVAVPTTNPKALATWPAAKSGYTLVLESLPISSGKASAVARARQAKAKGLPDVGVLVSSRYSSLHPGYYVVFSGIYGSSSQAAAAVASAHSRGFPDAYQTRVTK
jgi:hypothetical protein